MTFGAFIKIINNTKVFRYSRDMFALELLQAAGIKESKEIQPTTVSKWIDRKVPNHINSYFEDAKVKEAEVLKFFRENIRDRWEELQNAFSDGADCCKVDCSTNNQEKFYQSLLEELVMSLGLPFPESLSLNVVTASGSGVSVTESETSMIKTKCWKVSQDNTPPKAMSEIFDSACQDFGIEEFIAADPLNSMAQCRFSYVDEFLNHIQCHKKCGDSPGKGEEKNRKIFEFTNTLSEYVSYLRDRMNEVSAFENEDSRDFEENLLHNFIEIRNFENIAPKPFRTWYEAPKDDGGEFKTKTYEYQQQLKSLLNELTDTKKSDRTASELALIGIRKKIHLL